MKKIVPGPGPAFWPVDAEFAKKYTANKTTLFFEIPQGGFIENPVYTGIYAPTEGTIAKLHSKHSKGFFSGNMPAIEIKGLTLIENTETKRRGEFETTHIIRGIDLSSLAVGVGQRVEAGALLGRSRVQPSGLGLDASWVEYLVSIADIAYSPLDYLTEREARTVRGDTGGGVSAKELLTVVTLGLAAYVAYKLG